MVKLRLRRIGKKKQPMYKVVVANSQAARDGKFIESIGVYQPLENPMIITVNEDRLYAWLKRGAEPTDTVRSLLQRKGYWLRWALMKKGADEATIASEVAKWQALQDEKMRRETDRKARRKANRRKKAADAVAASPAVAAAAAPAPAEGAPAPAEGATEPAA